MNTLELELKPQIDKNWTLFLDRDGVINVESVGSYITTWEEFVFHEGVLDTLQMLSHMFSNIIVVSNQRGVGRGIMTFEALKEINANMISVVEAHGGRIGKVYSATATAETDHNRKPNSGMALQAQQDFPDIDFKHSIMVGNAITDMEFGKRLSMHTVFLTTKISAGDVPADLVDEFHESLSAWAKTIAVAEVAH